MKQNVLAKMRQRKKAMKERAEKKAKTVVVEGDRAVPYDVEKVLEELGEFSSTRTYSTENPTKKGKNAAKKERKRNQRKEKEEIVANDTVKETTCETEKINSVVQDGDKLEPINNSGGIPEADLNFQLNKFHNAVDNGNPSMVIMALLQNGKEVINSKDGTKMFRTALHKTVVQGNFTIAAYLIEKGAEIDIKDKNASTPLHLASIKGWKNIGQMLIKYGANINAKDAEGETPLHYAAYKDNVKVVKILIENKAEVNAKSNLGLTPIHIAASEGKYEVVKFLTEHGAEIEDKNVENKSPLDLANKNGHLKVTAYLAKIREETIKVQSESFTINNSGDESEDMDVESPKKAMKSSENIPTEVLEYLENIERENQKRKEALGFMETLIKKYENLNIQNQNLELQIQTLLVQNQNLEKAQIQAKNVEEARLCKICMEAEICYAFIPCGHQITCDNCVTDLKNCPICRKKITKCLKTYLS